LAAFHEKGLLAPGRILRALDVRLVLAPPESFLSAAAFSHYALASDSHFMKLVSAVPASFLSVALSWHEGSAPAPPLAKLENEGALLDARQEETASGAQDFTLPVTVEQKEVLIAAWYEMQEPEYQQFLTKFYQGPYASRGAEDTIEEVDETGSKPASSRVKECDHLDKTKASHDSVGNASAEAAKNSERYPKKKGCVFGLMTPTENREEAFAPDWH
jgi:hypothetical protein